MFTRTFTLSPEAGADQIRAEIKDEGRAKA